MAQGKNVFTSMPHSFVAMAVMAIAFAAQAVEVTSDQAQTAARNWVRRSAKHLTAEFASSDVRLAQTSKGEDGKALYHVVELEGGGFVVTSGDTELPPVIAFSGSGSLDLADSHNPLVALLETDMAIRNSHVSNKGKALLAVAQAADDESTTTSDDDNSPGGESFEDAWALLLVDPENSNGPGVRIAATSSSSISDVRVAPMVQSKWSQSTWNGYNTFNYYTPNNYVCGCVATAFAQIMRYWQKPSGSVTPGTYNCWVDYAKTSRTMKGGTYSWGSMPLTAASCSTDAQRQAIGKLLYDVGVASQMGWGYDGSGTLGCVAAQALRHRFGYASAHSYGGGYSGSLSANLSSKEAFQNAILGSLDAGMPVAVGIDGSAGGHEVVVDGYGYNGSSTIVYCHINCGWSGSEDAWYNLIGEGITSFGFSSMSDVSYNIHPTASGDVISGRVLNANSSPVSGATVTLTTSSGSQRTASTNAKGIYWFRAEANASYTVSASYGGQSSAVQSVFLPASGDTEYEITGINRNGTVYYSRSPSSGLYPDGKLGNKWGVNLTLGGGSSVSLATALDNSTLTFTTGGSASWFGQTSQTYDGVDAARSGSIGNSQETWMQTTVTGPGIISFYWNVSCEGSANNNNWDYLSVSVDGEEKARICGTGNSWTRQSYSIPSGTHIVQWLYNKDGSASSGEDAGFVDQVVWEPTSSPGDAYDPGDDTPGGGTSITPSDSLATHGGHTLSSTDKYDFFRVYLSAGYRYVFTTTGSMDTYGDLFDSTSLANSVACNDDSGDGRNFKIEYTPESSGTYYLRVRAYTVGTAGSYSLSYQRFAADGGSAVKPDILPYAPSGWSSPLVVADSNLSKEGETSFSKDDSLYVSWAVVCRNAAASETFYSRLYVDGRLVQSWYTAGLQKNYYAWVGGFLIGSLDPGTHTIRIVHDETGVVAESNESNNTFETVVTVTANGLPNLRVVDETVSKTSISLSEPVIVHWRVKNEGRAQSAKSKTALRIYRYNSSLGQSQLLKTIWVNCTPLAAGAGRNYRKAISLKSYGTGTYSFVITADGKSTVAETDETDNSDTATVYVTKNISTKKTSLVDWKYHKRNSSEPSSFYLSTSAKSKKKVSTFKRGQTIYVQLNFWNSKKVRTLDGVYVRAQLNGGGSQTWYWPPMGWGVTGYISNASRTPSILQGLPAGTYTLTATLDCYDNWWETSELNNIQRLTFKVVEAPQIYGESDFECALNEPVNWAISSEGTVTVKGLPPGLKYSGGAIVGKASKTGTYTVKFTAKNAAGTRTKTIRIVVRNPGFVVGVNVRGNGATGEMAVSSGETVPMYMGVVQKITVSSTPGKAGVAKSGASSVTVTGLPPGLKYSKGVISGVPTKTGTYTVKLVFRNALGWSKSFTMKISVRNLPNFARKTFNGWTFDEDYCKRKVTFSVTTTGGMSAKVGSLTFSRTGWTVDARGMYVANMRTVRKSGKKTYTDVLTLTLDPDAEWTEDQLTGYVVTFNGTVTLTDALSSIETLKDEGLQSLVDYGLLPVPRNADVYVSARRNPFGDANNEDAIWLATQLAALGSQKLSDSDGVVWNTRVASNGVATISRTTGTGKSKKTVTATAVVMWDGGDNAPRATFLVDGKAVFISW